MIQSSTKRYDFSWDTSQAAVLMVACVGGAIGLWAVVSAGGVWSADGEPPKVNPCRAELADEKIDLNTASDASLLRLPGVGGTRAGAIIEFRALRRSQGEVRPFRSMSDVRRVKGIGAGVSKEMEPHLDLPP
jgi:DNA uptake protein ComE-like DNA-binding protein